MGKFRSSGTGISYLALRKVGNLSLFYKHEDKTELGITANFSERDRYQSKVYSFGHNGYVPSYSDVTSPKSGRPYSNPEERYPHPNQALDNYGINAFFIIQPQDNIRVDMRCGYQDSLVQKIFVATQTPFTTNDSESRYLSVNTEMNDFSARLDLNNGDQDTLGLKGWKYDFTTYDFTSEYDFQFENFSLIPGISFRKAVYDGSFIGGSQDLTTKAAFVRAEHRLSGTVKLIAALRIDDYNYPDDRYPSWQFSANWKPDESSMLRAVYSRAHRAPFFLNTFMDFELNNSFKGNKDLDLVVMDMVEFGFRQVVSESFHLDLQLFYARAKDYEKK